MFRLVFVDDESWALTGLCSIIDWKVLGFEVCGCCTSAVEALELIERCHPHAVFTDIRMPGMSGIELIAKMKAARNNLEFIIISAHSDFEVAKKAIQYGAYDYLLKPLDAMEAMAVARRLAATCNARRDAANPMLCAGKVGEADRRRLEAAAVYRNCYLFLTQGRAEWELRENNLPIQFEPPYFGYALSVSGTRPDYPNVFWSRRYNDFSELNNMYEDARIAMRFDFQYSRHDTVSAVQRYLSVHFKEEISLGDLAAAFFLNEAYLSDLFKRHTGMTILHFLKQIRIRQACYLLHHTNKSLQCIATESGYADYSYFGRLFKKATGMPPDLYRKQSERADQSSM